MIGDGERRRGNIDGSFRTFAPDSFTSWVFEPDFSDHHTKIISGLYIGKVFEGRFVQGLHVNRVIVQRGPNLRQSHES